MIELGYRRLPPNERKICAIVFGMTGGALLAGGVLRHQSRMQPTSGGDSRCNLGVAFEALERRLRADFMTARAVRRSVQKRMWLRERAGRDLRVRIARDEEHQQS